MPLILRLQYSLLILTPFVVLFFGMGLYEKIKRPTFKNLPTELYILAALILTLIIVSDIYYIKDFIKRKNKTSAQLLAYNRNK